MWNQLYWATQVSRSVKGSGCHLRVKAFRRELRALPFVRLNDAELAHLRARLLVGHHNNAIKEIEPSPAIVTLQPDIQSDQSWTPVQHLGCASAAYVRRQTSASRRGRHQRTPSR
jgi:hypothetical protein